MALVLKDRVRESSTTSGTGSITLAGAYTGYQSFATAIASGSTVYYTIRNTTAPNDGEWEVGVGTFTSPSTLSRDTVFSSSTGGSKVSFSGSSTLEVFVTQPAEQAVYINDATGKVEVFGNGTNTVTFTSINTTNLVANTVTLTAGTISTNAANATDITNKTYVDGLFSTGISYHNPVLVESPTALNATYNQPGGAGNGVGATLTNAGANVALSIDGVTLSNTARVLVYTQANAVQNGIYTVTNPGNGSAQWVLTRATDADTFGLADPNKLGQGDAVFVQSGNTGAGETYVCNTPGTITFGSTNITFAQISSAQVYSAGTGLNLSNLTFSIANTAVTAATYGNSGAVATFTVNAQGQITNAANTSINASSITLGTLDNARTTASASNGANTIVLRDSTGSFTANTITATTSNATTFNGTTGAFTNVSGNGSAISAINASNISSGTIANARTTASDANSASTIVARDANGSFGANIVTATFSGNAAGLSAINASNISSGTIANARTTASSSNGASTIVQRDSGGNFSANTVTAAVIGDLSGGSAINASNISSGTIANARTTASSSNGASTIVLRGASGEFAAGAITGSSFSGNGSAITAINASAITTGTIDNARTTASSANGASTIVARDAGGNFSANTITVTAINATSITNSGLTANRVTYATTGGQLTDSANMVFATQYNTGANPALYSLYGVAVGTGTLSYPSTNTGVGFYSRGGTSMGGFLVQDGNGRLNQYWNAYTDAGIKYIVSGEASARYLMSVNSTTGGLHAWYGAPSGTAGSAITFTQMGQMVSGTGGSIWFSQRGTSSDFFMGTSGGVSIGNTTDPGASNLSVTGAITAASISANGVALTAINASNITSGTIDNARTTASSSNGASTIVLRGTSGEFSAGAITSVSISGNGSALTAINASNISTGTVATARLATGTANSSTYLRGDQTWATVTAGVTITNDTSTNASYYPVFTTATSGSISAANVSSTELIFNPGLNQLTAPHVLASNGLFVNNRTIASSYTIPSGYSAMSTGPITLSAGVSVTVPSGSKWAVL